MPIFDMDRKTYRYSDEGDLRFEVRCDCSGGARCSQLDFNLFSLGDDEMIPMDLYVTLVPRTYPWGFWDRIKEAWCILVHGRGRYGDDMCLEVETIEGLVSRLKDVIRMMRGADPPQESSEDQKGT